MKLIKKYTLYDYGLPFGDETRIVIAEFDHEPTDREIGEAIYYNEAIRAMLEVEYSVESGR